MAWGDKVEPNPTDPQDTPFELEGVTQQDFDTVRSLLLTSLTEDVVPNEMISNDGYLVDAIREVRKSLGEDVVNDIVNKATTAQQKDPSLRTDEDRKAIERFSIYKLAVLLLTAYYMCEAVEELASESLGPIRRSWEQTDWLSQSEKLLKRHQEKLDELTVTDMLSLGLGFGILRGSRGSFGRRSRGSM